MANLSGKDKIKDFDYEKKVWGSGIVHPSPFYIQGLKLKYTLEALKDVKGKILDIGCGGGNIAKAIKKYRPDLDIYGIDISKKAIDEALKDPMRVSFSVGTCEKIPFKDNAFDALVMYDVLEHVEKPEIALREMKRVVKKNGKIHIFSPLDGQPWTLYSFIYKLGWQPKNTHTGHLHVFSSNSFEELLNKNRFHVISKKYSFHYFFSLFDIAYFSLLEIMKYNPDSSIEGMIESRKKSIPAKLFNILYRIVIASGYYESQVLSSIPGGGGHFTVKPI